MGRYDSRMVENARSGLHPLPTAEEVAAELQLLLSIIQNIDADLSAPDRVNKEGKSMTDKQYDTWRYSAIKAKNAITRQYRELKEWDKERKRKAQVALLTADMQVTDATNPVQLLMGARVLLKRLCARHDVVFPEDEQVVVNAITQYLLHHAVATNATEQAL